MAASQPDIASLRHVIERDPASALFYDLAVACSETEAWEEAERVLAAGLKFHPEHLPARVLRGLCLVRLGEPEAARGELEAAAEALGRLAERLYPELAAVCEETGRAEGGLVALRLAAAFGPLEAGAAERLQRLEARWRQEQAGRASRQAQALLEEGRAAEAVDLLGEALGEAPGEPELEERLREAEAQAAREREAGQMIAVLQDWLHNIRETPGH